MESARTVIARYGSMLLRPFAIATSLRRSDLRGDLVSGLTVAVVAVPQCIAYAAVAGLPPSYGLYTACVATVVGALWGSSRFLSTGPTNAVSILILSVLAPVTAVGSSEFMLCASLIAICVGVFCVVFALAGLGMLVNFASRAVLLGFTAGAGVLIAVGQLRHLLRLDVSRSPRLFETVTGIVAKIDEFHPTSLAIGVSTVLIVLVCTRWSKRCPGPILAVIATGIVVAAIGPERLGVQVVGSISRQLPAVTDFDLEFVFSSNMVSTLLTGSLAVAALGLVEAVSIARELARQSGDHLDINQELVGQGVANIAAGIFSGYAASGSFTRSAVNYHSGARSQLSSVFAGLLILAVVLAFGPLAEYLPRAALAGLIMVVAYQMVDWSSVARVLKTSRVESSIMAATFFCTLILPLEFAVLGGVILSLAIHVYQSSLPRVFPVLPDELFRHFVTRPDDPACPQLAVMNIQGSLFFGAASHVEDELLRNRSEHPGQRVLLLRMHGVHQCDLSGIEALESVTRTYRSTGGEVYVVRVRRPVMDLMKKSGFEQFLGLEKFLAQEKALDFLFEEEIDPGICCYECEHRVFAECQAIDKHSYDARLPVFSYRSDAELNHLTVRDFEDALIRAGDRAVLIDVREPEEFAAGHLAGARLLPLRRIIDEAESLPRDRPLFMVCRSGRRSTRAMHWLLDLGFEDVYNIKGGILSWKAKGRPLEVD
jgi:SulP family sulfate permease